MTGAWTPSVLLSRKRNERREGVREALPGTARDCTGARPYAGLMGTSVPWFPPEEPREAAGPLHSHPTLPSSRGLCCPPFCTTGCMGVGGDTAITSHLPRPHLPTQKGAEAAPQCLEQQIHKFQALLPRQTSPAQVAVSPHPTQGLGSQPVCEL